MHRGRPGLAEGRTQRALFVWGVGLLRAYLKRRGDGKRNPLAFRSASCAALATVVAQHDVREVFSRGPGHDCPGSAWARRLRAAEYRLVTAPLPATD